MLKALMLQKKRTALNAKLKALRAQRKKLAADEAKLQRDVEGSEEISEELEKQIEDLTDQQTKLDDQIAEVLDQLDDIQEKLDTIEADVDDGAGADDAADEEDDTRGRPAPQRRSVRQAAPVSRNFNCRSRCFETRAQRDAFYARPAVADFLGRVRTMLGSKSVSGQRRGVTGAELTIPTDVLDILRDNSDQYSKLAKYVRNRQVSGHARQPIIGDIPEGVWMEMKGALNELTFAINEVETDGFAVGGVIILDNYLLQDSDIALGEEVLYQMGQAVGMARDKAYVYGKGKDHKMPLGFVTRLAQTSEPTDWGEYRRPWKDLHSSNILKLNLASSSGADFFVPFLGALAKAKTRYTNGERVWVMNEATKIDILIKSLGIDSAAAIVAGMNNTMPIIGGAIETEEFMPDFTVGGGCLGAYLEVEREGGTFGYSDQPLYIQNKTVFKGYARYDGTPLIDEDFVLINYANIDPATEISFALDAAGEGLNALIITAAAGSKSGDTALTVAGKYAVTGKLLYKVGTVEHGVVAGLQLDDSWVALPANGNVTAAAGVTVTVVEVDDKDRAVSFGTVASVPKA